LTIDQTPCILVRLVTENGVWCVVLVVEREVMELSFRDSSRADRRYYITNWTTLLGPTRLMKWYSTTGDLLIDPEFLTTKVLAVNMNYSLHITAISITIDLLISKPIIYYSSSVQASYLCFISI